MIILVVERNNLQCCERRDTLTKLSGLSENPGQWHIYVRSPGHGPKHKKKLFLCLYVHPWTGIHVTQTLPVTRTGDLHCCLLYQYRQRCSHFVLLRVLLPQYVHILLTAYHDGGDNCGWICSVNRIFPHPPATHTYLPANITATYSS